MNTYAPPFKLTNTMLDLVASISEKVGRITTGKNLESKPHLRKNNRVKSIYSSLKIEANSLTIGQVRDVIDGKLVLGEQKEIQEVKNAYEAYEKINEIDPYDIEELKHIHGIMTKYLIDESGCFRHGEEGVFNGEECIFMAPPARFVPHLMEELFDWMEREKEEVHPLILSCVFHYEFVFIHPFADGNGRMGRLWQTLILSRWNPIFANIPVESLIYQNQKAYYEALQASTDRTDSAPFIEFILQMILDAILSSTDTAQDSDHVTAQVNVQVSDQVQHLISAMKLEDYTLAELMQLVGLNHRATFQKNYLNPAIEADLIERTIPDKPKSPKQRYRLKS